MLHTIYEMLRYFCATLLSYFFIEWVTFISNWPLLHIYFYNLLVGLMLQLLKQDELTELIYQYFWKGPVHTCPLNGNLPRFHLWNFF